MESPLYEPIIPGPPDRLHTDAVHAWCPRATLTPPPWGAASCFTLSRWTPWPGSHCSRPPGPLQTASELQVLPGVMESPAQMHNEQKTFPNYSLQLSPSRALLLILLGTSERSIWPHCVDEMPDVRGIPCHLLEGKRSGCEGRVFKTQWKT